MSSSTSEPAAWPRPRGVTLRRLDLSLLLPELRGYALDPIPAEARIELCHAYALAQRPAATFVLRDDGVGWRISDIVPFPLAVYLVEPPGRCPTGPKYVVNLDLAEVEACVTDETVELAEFVTAGNPAVEHEFTRWWRRLSD